MRGAKTLTVEQTPLGLVFSPADDPGHLWPRYLSQRLTAKPAATTPNSEPLAEEDNAINLRMPNLIEGLMGRDLDPGGGIPFPRPRQDVPGPGFGPGLRPGFGPGGPRPGVPPFGPGRPRRFFPPPHPAPWDPAPCLA